MRLITLSLATVVVLTSVRSAHAASCTVPVDSACPTIQAALDQSDPGDTISVNSGVYSEKISFPIGGTAADPIILQASAGHRPVLDGTGVAGSHMILIDGTGTAKDYIVVRGLEIRKNLDVNDGSGIRILGAGTGIELRNNEIHNITGDHAMAITVYASEPTAVSNLVIDGNNIHDCEPAQSEAVTLNGNVDGFQISNNIVRDVNNIGIDCIGGETDIQPNPALVCRNGVIRGNTVIRANADYGSGFAGGIYVDGGRDIIIENNVVTECDLGIEVGAENPGLITEHVKVRNNIIYSNGKAGIVFGGYAANVGRANNNEFRGNTLFHNNDSGGGDPVGEIWIQFAQDNVIENNIVYVGGWNVIVASYDSGSSIDNTLDYNLFYSNLGSITGGPFILNGVEYFDLAEWQAATGNDGHSIVGNPLFVDPSFGNFHISAFSPAVNAGNPGFTPDVGEIDVDGQPRKIGAAADAGADEGTCGNSALDPGEGCDDGNNINCDGCDSGCKPSTTCGNGVYCTAFEDCDDGNTNNGDCCSSTCTFETAGTECSDESACTVADVCDGAGYCDGENIGGPVCEVPKDRETCQYAIARSALRYLDAQLKGLQKCRNVLNNNGSQYLDADGTMPLAGPDECSQEFHVVARSSVYALQGRNKISDKCTDMLVGELTVCATTIDGLIGTDGTTGCLLTTHAAANEILIDDAYGIDLTGLEANYDDLRRCQEGIAKASRKFLLAQMKRLQKCRKSLDNGKLLYFDADETMPLTNPVDCASESRTAEALAKARMKVRTALEGSCTDDLVAGLGGACAATVDGMVAIDGNSGCLIDGHQAQADDLIAAEY